jgi:hypothetical protein
VEPELGRDATVAIILIAAIVAMATGTIALGLAVVAGAALLAGVTLLVRSLVGHPRDSRTAGPRGH